jgi:type III restriction enzyme
MFKPLKYQEEAVTELQKDFYKLLKKPSARHIMVFKAPTGSGKTVMMATFLNRITEELPERTDLEKQKVAYIWIAPNKLYIQSYDSIKNYFSETRTIRPIFFEDVTGDALQPNEVLFVNWESINKEKNMMVRNNETNKNLYSFVNQSKLKDIEIIVIIDEEHMFANPATALRAGEVLQKIYPKVEIRVSATPVTTSDYRTVVERQDVIDEEMIKEGIILNPALDQVDQQGRGLEEILLQQAIQKRLELKAAYEEIGVNVNPLLLIQLPNDTNESNSANDEKYINIVLQNLEVSYNITVQNNKLAVWLSGRKDNLDEIAKPENMVEVLLFKQAIALGWDCPRAGVLLIFRELHSPTFSIQTVGRILRMPEQKHYPNTLLNQGYVYTNLSRDIIEIVRDDMTYITMNLARRIENYKPVHLDSTYINTRIVRNRLGSKFRLALYRAAEELWGVSRDIANTPVYANNKTKMEEKLINLDVDKINISIPENVTLTGDLEEKVAVETARFAKTLDELNKLFRIFCRANIGPFAPVDSTPVLELALKMYFKDYLGLGENNAVKIVLEENNKSLFIELIERALENYNEMQAKKAKTATKDIQEYKWEVPVERVYNELYNQRNNESHALEPFYEYNRASSPEKHFVKYLEDKKEFLEWWYKNGESAKEHFAVPYIDASGKESLFYVDFVALTKTEVTCLFDTKSSGSDPANAPLKHNALVDYIHNRNEKGLKTVGGVIIGREINNVITWRYCSNKIINTTDFTGWEFFKPEELN